jgi:glycosyltransferase involved in cell wall biosynthesis
LGISDRFILAGFTDELDHYMHHFDLFVQSSHTEGLPNVLLEAAAAGVPVVATDVGGTAELVLDGVTGLLVASGDATALAVGVRRLLEDVSLRRDMTRAAPLHIAKSFTFGRQADKYRTLFGTLVPEKQKQLEQREAETA